MVSRADARTETETEAEGGKKRAFRYNFVCFCTALNILFISTQKRE